jgi:hypothetical protein
MANPLIGHVLHATDFECAAGGRGVGDRVSGREHPLRLNKHAGEQALVAGVSQDADGLIIGEPRQVGIEQIVAVVSDRAGQARLSRT